MGNGCDFALYFPPAVEAKEFGVKHTWIAGLISVIVVLLAFAGAWYFTHERHVPADALSIQTGRREVFVRARIASTESDLAEGVRGEVGLAEGSGILFVITNRGPGFWMKDVGFSLDVAFLDECGKFLAIQSMAPNSLDFHTIDAPYSFGLEVPGGWFQKKNIQPGAHLEIPAQFKRCGDG